MKKIYTMFAAALCAAQAFAYTTAGNGTVYTPADLAKIDGSGVTFANGFYTVAEDLEIADTDGLAIEGVTLALADGVTITTNGPLTIKGAPAANRKYNTRIIPASDNAKPQGFKVFGSLVLAYAEFDGAQLQYISDEPLLINECNFINGNGELSGFGTVAIMTKAKGNLVENCYFENCYVGCIQTSVGYGCDLIIRNNTMVNCSLCNQGKPFINLAAPAEGVTEISNNVIEGALLQNPQAIGVSNMYNTPGDNKVVIKGNKISKTCAGINLVGGMDVVITDNMITNCLPANCLTSAYGVSIYSVATYPMTAYLAGNTIDSCGWGVWNIGAGQVNLGNISVAESDPAYNPGLNTFKNIGFDNNGTRKAYALSNYTPNTLYAQNNYWLDAANEDDILTYVEGKNTVASYGEVIVTPAAGTGAVNDITSDTPATAPVYYNLRGQRVINPQPGQLLIERRGTTTRKLGF